MCPLVCLDKLRHPLWYILILLVVHFGRSRANMIYPSQLRLGIHNKTQETPN